MSAVFVSRCDVRQWNGRIFRDRSEAFAFQARLAEVGVAVDLIMDEGR